MVLATVAPSKGGVSIPVLPQSQDRLFFSNAFLHLSGSSLLRQTEPACVPLMRHAFQEGPLPTAEKNAGCCSSAMSLRVAFCHVSAVLTGSFSVLSGLPGHRRDS